jgi:RNA polymerase sigma factor (sigma-70 family)
MSPRISIRLLASQSDQRLAALAAEGHERAFEALVHRYRRALLRYCRRMRLGDARAEDVLQQALLQAWMAFARGTEVRDVRPWLYRIVHNAAVNAMRGNAADGHSELTEQVQANAALAGESNLQRRMAVREALTDVAALPQMQQQAIFLTAVDGQSHDEVADVLGISEGALRGLLYRARTTLRSAAAALMPPPLLAWATGGPGAAGPTAERIAELSAGGGAAGIGGLLIKGAVVAVTAGAVATGATVVNSDSNRARPAGHPTPSGGSLRPTADAGRALQTSGTALPDDSVRRAGSQGRSEGSHRHGRHGHDGTARRGDDHPLSSDGQAGSSADDGTRDGQTQGDSPSSSGSSDGGHGGSSAVSGGEGSSGDGKGDGGKASGGGQGSSSGGSTHSGADDDVAAGDQTATPQEAVAPVPSQSQASATASPAGNDAVADDGSGGGSGSSKGGSGSDG